MSQSFNQTDITLVAYVSQLLSQLVTKSIN